MKVAVYYSNDDVRLEDRPVPRINAGEILVKMMASGICGTDVMQWYRQKKAPRVLGHEMAGEIVETGKGVDKFKTGDRVFVSHHVPCYNCSYCLNGNYTACEALHTGNYEPGGFSEYIRVPAENVKYGTLLLPDGMTYEDAAMIEPLACVVLGQKKIGLKKGQTILVIGSGISGLMHIQMAKSKGATVIATDINEYRLNKALEFGADHVFNANEYSAEKLKDVNKGGLAEQVIVCASAKQAIDDAISSIDRNGKILFFAVSDADINIPAVRFWRDEITVTFSYGAAPEDLKTTLNMIHSNIINARNMISHRIPLSNIQQGFKLVSEAKESLKVVITP
ncbi:MAG: alcohol dehydrogenase catalytic domain-containing protein [Nitrospirae bacterium]|nr:alcohol dehydrogenase catalytic domain-containing protein [Nitrospirota bacterium]